jgi:arylsulfate sulfotransferase
MRKSLLLFLVLTGFCFTGSAAPLAVKLHSSLPSPQPVGVTMTLSPRTENHSKGMHVYRYSVSVDGGPFKIVRDFSQARDFTWAPALEEHSATVRLSVRNNESKETAQDEIRFQLVSRIKGKGPVVTPSAHPLIALFSAPGCPAGGSLRVAFQADGETSQTRTSTQPCQGAKSNNVWVAGMRADTDYKMRAEWVNGTNVKSGSWLPFHTGMLGGGLAPVSVLVPKVSGASASEAVHIYGTFSLTGTAKPLAVDDKGRVIWYSTSGAGIFRVLPGGRFLVVGEGMNSANSTKDEQVLQELDLHGNIIRETNASRVAEQLTQFGIKSDCRHGGKECVSGFHHEALRLPNGHTLVIAGLERMMPAGTQGAKEEVDVLGDIVIDLDEEFQATQIWNSFDHLDIKKKSYKDATCKTGQGGCPPVLLAPQAHGWTHSNSLNYIASSGDFLISIPEQEWVLKVDWKNGKGSGKILWRLGNGGDLKLIANDANPWFSYAHDIGFEPAGSNMLAIMDNSHVAHAKDAKLDSRAQVFKIDEAAKTATLVYNASLGGYSICCGSIQLLKNGGYNTLVGWIDMASPHALMAETDKNGKTVFAMGVEGTLVYRSFNVPDMYTAPVR